MRTGPAAGIPAAASRALRQPGPPLRVAVLPTALLLAALLLAASPPAAGQHGTEAAADTAAAAEGIEIASDLAIHPFADYPMLASPVALAVGHDGAVYVTETDRRKTSNLDIRDHRGWMREDLRLTSIEEKARFYRRRLAPARSDTNAAWLPDRNDDGSHDFRDLTVQSERIHRIVDVDGDGRADRSEVFAEGFRTVVTGVAAGVLPVDSTVYLTVAPDLWRLRDTDSDGHSDARSSLSHGYGVHMSFAGHDMSGLTRGPDGKIYWSIGDIGLNVVGPDGRRWRYPNQGAVMRANPDGSEFEVFAHGLRNPQEIAFDRHGNLFGVDNDGDHAGEHERIVYVTEGSDAGWRTNWQFGKYSDPGHNDYNVWMDERLHVPRFDGQAAYITPAVALYRNGPSGFAYNPGTALDDRWDGFFFSSHFTGSASGSHVSAFRVEPEGATFELAEERDVVRGVLIPSLAFGPSGDLYLADWIEGWDVQDQGRVWRVTAEETAGANTAEAEAPAETAGPARTADESEATARLLAEGMYERSIERLRELLVHPDMRVRMQAQFELAERGERGERVLLRVARSARDPLARLHGIWGVGQRAEARPDRATPLVDLLSDADPEVRAQSAKVLGEAGHAPAAEALIAALKDPAPRVRFFSAVALGKLGVEGAVEPIVEMLARNAGSDAYLRHAGAEGLARIGAVDRIAELANHSSPAVRRAAVVALRQLRDPSVARFLEDPDSLVITEAARAIHDDFSIDGAMADLAALLDARPPGGEALYRRIVNANLRVGGADAADRLARYAVRSDVPEGIRVEAITDLRQWPNPPNLDRVTGRYRLLPPRDTVTARRALAPHLERLLSAGSDTVRIAAARAAGALGHRAAAGRLFALLGDRDQPDAVRSAALRAIRALEHPETSRAVRTALASDRTALRQTGLELIAAIDADPAASASMLEEVLSDGTLRQAQQAARLLGELGGSAADSVLVRWMDRLIAGRVPRGLEYELLRAANNRSAPSLDQKLSAYREHRSDDALAAYSALLFGGDVQRGREIFFRHPSAQCARCHRVGDRGGGEVGPELTGIAVRRDRRALMESLVRPSAEIAPGFGSAPSSMPVMDELLTEEELRDVVAYLATLDGEDAE